MAGNPFTYGNPISDPKRFIGRRREAEQVFSRLRNPEFESSSIVGERRTGKTSLLNFISHPQVAQQYGLDPASYIFVHLDLEMILPVSPPAKLYQLMLRRMASKIDVPEAKDQLQESSRRESLDIYDLEDVFDLIDQKDLHVALLMDEFENIGSNENFGPDFYYGLRSLAIHHNLALITASRMDLVELSHSDAVRSSPFFNIFATIYLRPFTADDVRDMTGRYLAESGVSFSQSEVDRVSGLAGGYPFYLQMAFHFLFQSFEGSLKEDQRLELVEWNFLTEAHPHLEGYWQNSTEVEKIALTLLALLEQEPSGAPAPRASSELERWFRSAGIALDGLTRRGLVTRTDSRYAVISKAFARWVLREVSAPVDDAQAVEGDSSWEEALSSLPDVSRRRASEWLNQTDTRYRRLFARWMSDARTAEATCELLGQAQRHFRRVIRQPLSSLQPDAPPEQFVQAALASNETIAALSAATEAKDPYTKGHTVRVAQLAVVIGQKLGLPADQLRVLARAGLLHDVGKMGIPDSILLKQGPLTPEEFDIIKRHPTLGLDIVRPAGSLEQEWMAIQAHHERMDGTGYPQGLQGDEIPLAARIMGVADVYDSVISDRPYRKGLPQEEAVEILKKDSGAHLDPEVVRVLLGHLGYASV